MPRFDGTGPQGTGPIGWGMGPCGRAMSFRKGFGRGYGRFSPVYYEPTKEEERKMLLEEKKVIEKRLKELSG
jgi:hypothetical protein